MKPFKIILFSTLLGGTIALGAVAEETATIDGLKVIVSGSKSAEEKFKRVAKQHADESKKKEEKRQRLRTKAESANLGPLKPYVMGVFTHGFDWNKFKQYEHLDTAPLFSLLEDPDWIPHWGQALGVIGAIADKEGAENLLSYIQRDDFKEDLHGPAMRVKADAISALGRTVMRGAFPEGMSFLEAHVMPDDWKKTLATLDISDRKAQELHRRTILVLSAIGTDEAVEILTKARDSMAREYRKKHQETGAKQNLKEHLRLIDFYIEKAKLGPLDNRYRGPETTKIDAY